MTGSKGGRSRSLAKLDAVRRNGAMPCRPGRKRGPRPGKRKLVPPLNAPEVVCIGGCGFSMILSRAAMEANSRGKAIVWTCPQCGDTGNRIEPRTCPTPHVI